MIDPIKICDLCPKRAGILGERMEGETINAEAQDLILIQQQQVADSMYQQRGEVPEAPARSPRKDYSKQG